MARFVPPVAGGCSIPAPSDHRLRPTVSSSTLAPNAATLDVASPTAPTAPDPVRAGYLPALDGLRAISIAMVLFSHLIIYSPHHPVARRLATTMGATGVSVFFVVSGYLITTLLLKEEARTGRVDLRQFYIRRALRIFPAAYTFQLALLALTLLGVIAVPWHDAVASVVYVRNIVGRAHETAHLWSLSLEEQFYFFWPALFLWTPRHRRLRVAVAIVAAVVVWRSLLVEAGAVHAGHLYQRTDLRMDTILLGCAMALVLARREWRDALARLAPRWLPLLGAPLLVGVAYWAEGLPLGGRLEATGVALVIAMLVHWVLVHRDAAAAAMLRRPAFVLVGRLSYSLYLWQQLFLGPREGPLATLRTPLLGLALALAAAVLSYHLVEQPVLRLKARFAPAAA